MRNKYLKIIGLLLLGLVGVISLNMSVSNKTDWGKLMEENIEALTTPEDNPYYPCVKAPGMCLRAGIKVKGVVLIIEK